MRWRGVSWLVVLVFILAVGGASLGHEEVPGVKMKGGVRCKKRLSQILRVGSRRKKHGWRWRPRPAGRWGRGITGGAAAERQRGINHHGRF
uniref:Uncharacterized protein n=1 Tax=Ammonifex degensii TaxID=42838 RepID=A0A7C1J4N2_9THEO